MEHEKLGLISLILSIIGLFTFGIGGIIGIILGIVSYDTKKGKLAVWIGLGSIVVGFLIPVIIGILGNAGLF